MDFTAGSGIAELGAELALVLAAGGFAELEMLALLESFALLALLALFGAREHADATR